MRLFDKLFGKKKEMEEMSYMEKMEKYCVICLLLLFLLFPLGAASAKTITVDDSGGADFTKIQSAVNTASEGDTIIVKDGIFVENVKINKSLIIRSESGYEGTIVETKNPTDHVFEIFVDKGEISGFTIKNACGDEKAGIYINNARYWTLSHNFILNNYYAVYLSSSHNNTFASNIISSNRSTRGFHLFNSIYNEITNNRFENGTRLRFISIGLDIEKLNRIENNTYVKKTKQVTTAASEDLNQNSNTVTVIINLPLTGIPDRDLEYTSLKAQPKVGDEVIIKVILLNTDEYWEVEANLHEEMPSSIYVTDVEGATYYNNWYIWWKGEIDPGESHTIIHKVMVQEEGDTSFYIAPSCTEIGGYKTVFSIWIPLVSSQYLPFKSIMSEPVFPKMIIVVVLMALGIMGTLLPIIKKKNRLIYETINIILLAVVTINTFIDFLPWYVATALGLLILWNILYVYQPKITRELYGTFAEPRSARLYLMFCAIPGYIIVLTPNFGLFLLVIVITIAFALSFSLNNDYHEANKGIEVSEQPFYRIMSRRMGEEDPVKWWERYKNLPESTTKEIYKLFWWSTPGLNLWLLGIVLFGIFWLISVYSQFFTIILAGWVLGWVLNSISIKSKWLSEKKLNLELERELLDIALILRSPKEMSSAPLFFTAFLIPGRYLFFLQSTYVTNFPLGYLYLLLLLPPSIYQFIFWYAMLRRFPSFFYCWKNGFSRSKSFSLPTGGLYVFIVSCVYSYIFFHFFENVSQLRELTFLLLLSVISFIYIGFILHTVKKWRKKEIIDDTCRDNFRIPLAFSIQLMSSLPFYMFSIRYPIPDASFSLYLILHLSLAIACLIVFFIADWLRFLDNRYPSHPLTPLRAYILFLLPFFVLVLLGNFIMSVLWEEGSMFGSSLFHVGRCG
jgi:parallel beta-helix repeat protein